MNAIDITRQFEKDYESGQDIRNQANEDMRFITIAGGMWEGFLEDAYANKPRMEYDMIEQSVEKFMGEWEENELTPNFKGDQKDDDKDAELLAGIFRANWRHDGGGDSAKIAVYEAVVTGFGALRLGTRYIDEEDYEDTRQDFTFYPVHSAYSTVVFDPNAVKIDKSDASHVSILVGYTKEAFEEKWPGVTPMGATPDDRRDFNWNSKDLVYVIEHYRKKKIRKRVNVFVNDQGIKVFVEDKDLEEQQESLEMRGFRKVKSKSVKSCYIEKSILTGGQWLEKPKKIVGKILPIIPFYGRFNVVDGQEVYRGIVRKEKDPSRVLNMQVSSLAENAATSIKEAPIFAPEQVKGLEGRWAEAHLGKKNIHIARPLYDKKGNIVQSGPSGYVKPPQIDPSTQGLIEFTTQHIRSTTAGMPENVEDPSASGKALLAVQKRVDMHTYSIMGNIVTAMRRVGECFVSMAQEILTDSRETVIINEDGSNGRVQLNEMFIDNGAIRTKNTFEGKRFRVYASAGKSYQSQRRETVEFLKELVQLLPEGDPRLDAVVSSIIDNIEGVGLDVVKDFNRKRMIAAGLVEPQEGNEEEEQLVAQLQQQQSEPDPMQELVQSQAALNMAEAESKQASNIEKLANADKKQAETAKILQDIGLDKVRMILDTLDQQQQSFTLPA